MLKFKFLISCLSLSLMIPNIANTQSLDKELVRADSLYENKQYINAIKIYENIYESGKSSPAMLLKLARIQEGMGNLGKSMYYLENYYRLSQDEKVLQHLKDTADKNKAVGFDYGFLYKANLLYHEWKFQIQMLFLLILIIGLILMIKNIQSSSLKKNYFILAVIPMIIIAFINNFQISKSAIIISQPAFLMEGPSSGANLVEKIEVPTKVKVKKNIDVWSEIIYNDKTAYIKTSQIKKFQ